MIQTNFNFQTQNLKIDFLTLTMPNSKNQDRIPSLARYFHYLFGFNCFLSVGNDRIIVETLFFDPTTKDSLIIRSNFWNQIVLELPGQSGNKLYQLLKSNSLDWDSLKLQSLRLNRLDLAYDQPKLSSFDPIQFDQFLLDSREYILNFTRTKNIKLLNTPTGRVLGINKRSSSRYFRLYDTSTQIRFEFELKNTALNFVQDFFFCSEFHLFEYHLTKYFFEYATRLFPLNNHFVSWLTDYNRKNIRNKSDSKPVLTTHYLTKKSQIFQIQDDERLFHLLQFLSFIQTLNPKESKFWYVEGKKYIIQEFYLTHFMQFIGVSVTKQSQRTKLVDYFERLHKAEPIVERFSDGSFRIFATFLFSGVKKVRQRWVVKVYVIEYLYNYLYPFVFSKSFLNYDNQTDCFLKLQLLTSISLQSVKKVFPFMEFIQQIKLSNGKIHQVKKDFLVLIQEIYNQGILESEIELITKNGSNKKLKITDLKITYLNQRLLFLVFYEKTKH